ncbi:hypothetical protein, partial [Xanthomonas sp. 3075]|uniref:hypothetical protein n=1 Tax=Xanthomonas sp. 3075 TaxID=3035315 RepID=UPI001C8651E6
ASEIAKNPKIQTRLSGTMRHPALSGLIVQTFPKRNRLAGIDMHGVISIDWNIADQVNTGWIVGRRIHA